MIERSSFGRWEWKMEVFGGLGSLGDDEYQTNWLMVMMVMSDEHIWALNKQKSPAYRKRSHQGAWCLFVSGYIMALYPWSNGPFLTIDIDIPESSCTSQHLQTNNQRILECILKYSDFFSEDTQHIVTWWTSDQRIDMVFPHWPSFDIGFFHVYSSHWQGVQETQFIAACGPPGGGRMPVGTPISLLFGNVDVTNLHPSECWTWKKQRCPDAWDFMDFRWFSLCFFWGQNQSFLGSQVTSIRPTTWDASN